MKKVLAVALLASCSLTGMKPVDPNWDERTDPRCEADELLPVGDTIGAIIFAGLGVAVAVAGTGNDRPAGVVLSGLVAAVLGGSAYWGFGKVEECKAARKIYDNEQIAQSNHLESARNTRPGITPVVAQSERGFFCATSASAPLSSFCTREKVACSTARDAAVGAVVDLTDCELREVAWCFGERCAPIRGGCEGQRKRAMGAEGIAPDCEERR